MENASKHYWREVNHVNIPYLLERLTVLIEIWVGFAKLRTNLGTRC